MFVRAYLRASTNEQDATRARDQLKAFAAERGMRIACWYVENESGAKLARPELFRLLNDSQPGDVLLIEQVDRLSRLTAADWERLRAELAARKMRVVSLDLPTSWVMTTGNGDDFTARMFDAINGMLAAVACKDYDDRRRRQAQGIAKAKAEGRQAGRPVDTERNARILQMLRDGVSWEQHSARHRLQPIDHLEAREGANRMSGAPHLAAFQTLAEAEQYLHLQGFRLVPGTADWRNEAGDDGGVFAIHGGPYGTLKGFRVEIRPAPCAPLRRHHEGDP
jgi:DNA invertase Pin-like site-specific DNA recombinase